MQEMFTALLMQPVSDLSKSEGIIRIEAAAGGVQTKCDITVGDILGPQKEASGGTADDIYATQRDTSFSLLSYSFNLVSPSGSLENYAIA